jgi:pimeloyl-ACP methyl ester carboxylesterase
MARGRLGAIAAELARRHALARQPQPSGVVTPSRALLAGELGVLIPRRYSLADVPQTVRPRPVMLLPGFLASSFSMRPLRRMLEEAGHRVSDWGLGFNLGASEDRLAQLRERVEWMAGHEGQPVALVGWSLGGVFAREVAKLIPDAVAGVITLGSPFSGSMRANNAWRVYHWVAGHDVDAPPIAGDLSAKPPVPTIALWSARDGVVAPRAARGRRGERDRAVAVRCLHMRFARDREVARVVLGLLDELP